MAEGERPRSEGNASDYDTGQARAAGSASPSGPFPAFLWSDRSSIIVCSRVLEFTWFVARVRLSDKLATFFGIAMDGKN